MDFPEEADSWDAVEDWIGDLEWIDNPVGYLIVINDCTHLATWSKEDFASFCELWPGGVAAVPD
ncbi:barstar family protein [Saccharopolyspora phatthalungensis]|uniref:barstar family protein n=1 Tax=Saccharopolyspora phatthalungensis TaxID=664693 RepID=UPI00406BAE95